MNTYMQSVFPDIAKEWIFVIVQQALLYSPNASKYASENASKLFRIEDLFLYREANQDKKACHVRKVPISLTCDSSLG